MKRKTKFKISYQGSLDYFCGIYAVINSIGVASSSFRVLTSAEKEDFFKCFLNYLIDKDCIKQVIEHGTSCSLEEKYLRLAQKYMKEKYNISIQWKKLSALKKWEYFDFAQIFHLISRWIRRKNHSCIIRVDTPQTGDHWTVFKNVKFPLCYLVDSYHFLRINFIKLAWKSRQVKNIKKETQIMKEGIFFISAKPLKTYLFFA